MDPDERLRLIADCVRDVPDFPKPGIQFKDITPVLSDPAAFNAAILDGGPRPLDMVETDVEAWYGDLLKR